MRQNEGVTVMSANLSVSFELICLMGWLLRNDKSTLRSLVKKALHDGAGEQIINAGGLESRPKEMSDAMGQTISDFFNTLEAMIGEEMDFDQMSESFEALEQLKNVNIDGKAVWSALAQTRETVDGQASELDENGKADLFREELFKNLLRNWEPAANETLN